MVVTPPNEMVWLTPQELQSMGSTMVGKPSQTAISPTATATINPSVIQQTQPRATFSSPPARINDTPTLSWDELVAKGVKRSAAQNNGKADYTRACQPEFKTCFNAVTYLDNDGVMTAAKVVKDMNDKIIRREICSFNKSLDIRKCFDWDDGTSHRDMKDANGSWYKVADE